MAAVGLAARLDCRPLGRKDVSPADELDAEMDVVVVARDRPKDLNSENAAANLDRVGIEVPGRVVRNAQLGSDGVGEGLAVERSEVNGVRVLVCKVVVGRRVLLR